MSAALSWTQQPDGRVVVPIALSGEAKIQDGKLEKPERWRPSGRGSAYYWAERAVERREVCTTYFKLGGKVATLCDEHEWITAGFVGSTKACARCGAWRVLESADEIPAIEVEPLEAEQGAPADVLEAVKALGPYTSERQPYVQIVLGRAFASDGFRLATWPVPSVEDLDEPLVIHPEHLDTVDEHPWRWPIHAAAHVLRDAVPSAAFDVAEVLKRAGAEASAWLVGVDPAWRVKTGPRSSRKPAKGDAPVAVEVGGLRVRVPYDQLSAALSPPWVPDRRRGTTVQLGVSTANALYVGDFPDGPWLLITGCREDDR